MHKHTQTNQYEQTRVRHSVPFACNQYQSVAQSVGKMCVNCSTTLPFCVHWEAYSSVYCDDDDAGDIVDGASDEKDNIKNYETKIARVVNNIITFIFIKGFTKPRVYKSN